VLIQAADDELPVKRQRAGCRICGIDLPALLENKTVIEVADVLVELVARQREEACLHIVRSAPAARIPGHIAAKHQDGRSVEVVAGVTGR